MLHITKFLLATVAGLALVGTTATAGEVLAQPVCCKKKSQACCPAPVPVVAAYNPCDRCDPCKVGPIRRFFRGCHRKPCTKCPPPPCCPPAPALVVPAPVVVPATPPAVVVPPTSAAAPSGTFVPPSANVPPPPPVFPGSGNTLRRSGTLTPPVPPPPVRADRIASNTNIDKSETLMLVRADRRAQQQTTADDQGRFRATLAAGTWHVYGKDVEGRPVYRGKLEVHEPGPITVRMR